MSDTQERLRELYYRKFSGGKLKKKKIYKKALQQITSITRTEVREKLGIDPRCPRDLELAVDALYLAVEIAALALSGKRTGEN
jgi:hypothetical protein